VTTAAAPALTRGELRRARLGVAVLAVCAYGAAITILAVIALNARALADQLEILGLAAGPVLVLVGATLIAIMVPPSLICAAAGFTVGTPFGIVVALTAAVLGSALCNAIGRLASTPATRHAFGQKAERAAAWVEMRPFRAVAVARLTPGTPFSVLGYCFGIVGIRMLDVALGTAVGFLPRCVAYVALGGSLRHLDQPAGKVAVAATLILCVAVVAVPRVVRRNQTVHETGGTSHG